jgi:hypothetical protein
VEDFFGVSFAERFSPGGKGQPVAQLAGLLERFNDVAETLELHTERERVVVTTLSWAPELLKRRLERLARDDETAFVALTKLVGEPPDIDVVLANVETPAAWLTDASSDVWDVIALMAEERGEWLSASHAWYEAATRTSDDYAAAGRLVSAAAAGHIGGDDTRRDELLAQARERFRDHPRVLIEDARGRPPQEQLDLLLDAETRDPLDVALVSSQRALSCLLLPDLEAAEAHLAEAKNALPHSLTTDSVEVNLVVQRGRLNQHKGGSQRVDALRGASRRALAIRDALLRQHRWEESGRLLMLAADALGLQGELAGARDILVEALPAELAAPDVAEVLGLAAIRTFAPREALELTKDAEQTSAVRCIRATATLQVVGASTTQRRQAVDELDVLVAEGGLNGLDAAFSRLMEAMAHGDWSDAAERLLTETGHERPATVLKALYLGARKADWEGAYALVDQMSDEAWAPPARLRLACRWGKHSVIREAADALMATAPGQGLRLECGQAYGKIREYARAREVLMSVANDDTAPSALRAHAYALLVLTVGRHLQDWAEADRLHQAWIDLRPGDARASAFAPEIANRLARERGAR